MTCIKKLDESDMKRKCYKIEILNHKMRVINSRDQ